MAEAKQLMEEECEHLQEALLQLTQSRTALQEEFSQLAKFNQSLLQQLQADSLAGEGHLHRYQAEKKHLDEKLSALEVLLQEKDAKIVELDARASEYLLQVTTTSNSLFDDEEDEKCSERVQAELSTVLPDGNPLQDSDDENASSKNPSASFVSDECASDESSGGSYSNLKDEVELEAAAVKNSESGISGTDSSVDHAESISGIVNSDIISKDSVGANFSPSKVSIDESASREEVVSLAALVYELRHVKEDMSKCLSVKEHSLTELEDQLRATNKELSLLKESMSSMSVDMAKKEEKYQTLEQESHQRKLDIEAKMSELQEITSKCSRLQDEKDELLHKMSSLEARINEYQSQAEALSKEKSDIQYRVEEAEDLEVARDDDSFENDDSEYHETSVSPQSLQSRLAEIEMEKSELRGKLRIANKHLRAMARERDYKQKECEALQQKVLMIESKMCELQGTFDAMVKAVMKERDDLLKEVGEKKSELNQLNSSLENYRSTSDNEIEKLTQEKFKVESELGKYRSGELKSSAVSEVDLDKLETLSAENEKLKRDVVGKESQINSLEENLSKTQSEMADFVSSLKEEMARMKDEMQKTLHEKEIVQEAFESVQKENVDVTSRSSVLEKSLENLEVINKEKSAMLESLRLQYDDVQQQLDDLHTKNLKLTSDLYSKEKEYKEELQAREATIQELNVTLANNKKQSMENYHSLQDDLAAMQLRLQRDLEDARNCIKNLEDKCRQTEEESRSKILELENKLSSTEDTNRVLQEKLGEAEKQLNLSMKCPPGSTQGVSEPSVSEETKTAVTVETQTSASIKDDLHILEDQLQRTQTELSIQMQNKDSGQDDSSVNELYLKVQELEEKVQILRRQDELTCKPEAVKPIDITEEVLTVKERRIEELERIVTDLEMSLENKSGYIIELEGKLEDSETSPRDRSASFELRNTVESQLELINRLSSELADLKEELQLSNGECTQLRMTVDRLERDRSTYEEEKTKLIEEYETRLQQANGTVEEAQEEVEQKKKLA